MLSKLVMKAKDKYVYLLFEKISTQSTKWWASLKR